MITGTINWVDVNDHLPPEPKYGKQKYLVTVFCESWHDEKYATMSMEWQYTTVRGNDVQRWCYLNRLVKDGWVVTHWAEYPAPAIKE